MRKWIKACMFAVVALVAVACGETSNEYTIGNCFLIIDNSTHQDATLAGCMNPNAPGMFCIIKTSFRAGVNYFEFTDNAGVSSSKKFNEIDSRRSQVLGYNNGIIVGYSALNSPATFYAFDLEKYINSRDFYFDFIKYVPGKIAHSQEEVIKAINKEDFCTERIGPFADMFFDYRDGKSTDRVVRLIYDCLNG